MFKLSAALFAALSWTLGGIASAQSVAALPFDDGFESGTLGPWWQTQTQGYGQVQVTQANGPNSGAWHVTMDTSQDGFVAHANMTLGLALAGQTDVTLSFAHRDYMDEPDGEDGVWLSEDGTHFFKALDLTNTPDFYQDHVMDLDAAASAAGLLLSTPFYVRFRWTDNWSIPTDGFAFDDVHVSAADCNMNGVGDALDIANGTSLDCNGNGFPDECDLSTGGSTDFDGDGQLDDCVAPPLYALNRYASIVTGGQQDLLIAMGTLHAGELYFTLGSISGTSPGFPVGGLLLPLNVDAYFLTTLTNPNSPGLVGSFGTLDAAGLGMTSIVVPPGLGFGLIGLVGTHATVTLDSTLAVTGVTNAVPITLVQ